MQVEQKPNQVTRHASRREFRRKIVNFLCSDFREEKKIKVFLDISSN